MKFEYLIEIIEERHPPLKDELDWLDRLGAEGWENYHIHKVGRAGVVKTDGFIIPATAVFKYYFKREC